jgi:hypothetical protein
MIAGWSGNAPDLPDVSTCFRPIHAGGLHLSMGLFSIFWQRAFEGEFSSPIFRSDAAAGVSGHDRHGRLSVAVPEPPATVTNIVDLEGLCVGSRKRPRFGLPSEQALRRGSVGHLAPALTGDYRLSR